jgi:diguanylate cyclase (GGDEF)-like protein
MKESPETEHQGFWSQVHERPFFYRWISSRYHVTPEENKEVMDVLATKESDHAVFVACFLLPLSIAYMIMYYALHMHPDDEFYSKIAMFLLFGSSLIAILMKGITHFKKILSPRIARFVLDFYYACLLTVMGLYFWASATNPNNRGSFCPSFLYLLIFTLVSSPFLLDGLFFLGGGLTMILTISLVGQDQTVLVLQYALIGFILLAGMIYLASWNYVSEVRSLRLNEANDELSFLSTHDQLTCANNRHSLHTYLAQASPDLIAKKSPVAFIMFDVDSFKSYNDNLSHMEGDEALKRIVNAIKTANLFPEEDFFRFGGDEFLIVLPDADLDKVRLIGRELVRAVYASRIPSAPDAPFPYLSISAGAYLGVMEESKNLDDYLAEADKELYLAKNNGQNRCYFLDEEVR